VQERTWLARSPFPRGGAELLPGVVLIAGSGPADRHSDGLFDRLGTQQWLNLLIQ
jgi:hypothetical protein